MFRQICRKVAQILYTRSVMTKPNLDVLSYVSADISRVARTASDSLKKHGVRHALCGGLAVGAYGHIRGTDVDFLVGPEAFVGDPDGLVSFAPGVPFRIGSIRTNSVPIPNELPGLLAALESPDDLDGMPIVSAEALVCMKLVAHRRKDQLDVIELLKAGATTTKKVLATLKEASASPMVFSTMSDRLSDLDRLASDEAE